MEVRRRMVVGGAPLYHIQMDLSIGKIHKKIGWLANPADFAKDGAISCQFTFTAPKIEGQSSEKKLKENTLSITLTLA